MRLHLLLLQNATLVEGRASEANEILKKWVRSAALGCSDQLPDTFKEEARELRNKLLLYRFHRRMHVKLDEGLADPKLEPRLNQILLPLLSVVSDADLRSDLGCMAAGVAASLVADWGMSVEAQVLEIVADVMTGSERRLIPLADIVAIFSERYGFEYERPICCDVFVFNAVSDSRSAFRCRPGSVL